MTQSFFWRLLKLLTVRRSFVNILFLISFALGLSGCSSLLYYPTQQLYVSPTKMGFKPDDVWLKDSENNKINGWYFHHTGYLPTLATFVIFHGNGENMSSNFPAFLWLLEHGYDFFIFDYEGYGRSEGDPSPEITVDDGKTVLRWLKSQYPKTPLVIYGQSLGGAVAMKTVLDVKNEIPVSLIFVDSSFSSYKAMAREVMRQSWLTWILQPFTYIFLSDKYAPDDHIKDISPIPLVVIHGDKDRTVNIQEGRKVFELARDPKEFWLNSGGDHIDALWGEHKHEFREKILKKLQSLKL